MHLSFLQRYEKFLLKSDSPRYCLNDHFSVFLISNHQKNLSLFYCIVKIFSGPNINGSSLLLP